MARKRKTRRPYDGGGSVFQLPSGLWRAQVPYKVWVDTGGTLVERRRYLSEDAPTRAGAELARERLCQQRERTGGPRERQTLGEYLLWWLSTVVPQRDVKDGAIRDYQDAVRRVVAVLGSRDLEELVPDDGDVLVLALKKTLAPRTVHKTIRVLNDALNGAVRRKKLAANPFAELDLPKIPKYRPVVLQVADIQRFRAAVAGHRWGLIYDLYLYTGMREGEVLGMQWQNLDWQTGAYRLTHDLEPRTLQLDTLKTEKARRIIYLPRFVVDALRRQYLDQQQLSEGPEWNPLGLMHCTSKGTPIRANNLWRHFKAVCTAIGLPERTTVHHLRHTFRHHAADQMPAHVMQALMGHSDSATTFEVYGDGATERAKQEVAGRLGELYGEEA